MRRALPPRHLSLSQAKSSDGYRLLVRAPEPMRGSGSISPGRAWLVVGLLWLPGCINYLDRVMITTMRSSLLEAIPMSDAQYGLLTTVFLFFYAALSPFAGFLADRIGRTRVIIGSLIAWSIVTWLTGYASSFE